MKKNFALAIVLLTFLALAVSCKSAPPPAAEPEYEDTAGPDLRVTFSPKYFSPDENRDELAIYLVAVDESEIGNWKIEIREPQPPYALFYEWEGQGTPPEMLSWNGRSQNGELVQSALDYPFKFTVSDVLGNSSVLDSLVEVDVFVIREGENLRIQIPSIVFSSNAGTWDDLSPETIAANDWVLRRIAQILTKFGEYQVRVEGHANPTADPSNTAASQRETRELQVLSEVRAGAIVDHLVKLGIDRGRLSSFGIGGAHPIVPWEDKDNWWKNRRVEFLLIK